MQDKLGNKYPLVSIFCFCKNRMKTIRRCIESIIAQDYPNIEIIVQDGASTDGTLEILQEYGSRINLVSEPDIGPGDAMFRALGRISGEFFGSCLSDEELLPHAVSWAIENLMKYPETAAIYGDHYLTDIDGNITGEVKPCEWNFERYFCSKWTPPFCASFFRRSCYEAINLREYTGCGEFDFWIRLGAKFPIRYVPDLVSKYAVHPEELSLQGNLKAENFAARKTAIERLCNDPETPESIRLLRDKAIASLYPSLIRTYCYIGAWDLAKKHAQQVFRRGGNQKTLREIAEQFYKRGIELHENGQLKEALEYFDLLVKCNVVEQGLHYRRADILFKFGRMNEAAEASYEELKLQPDHRRSKAIIRLVQSCPEGTMQSHNDKLAKELFKTGVKYLSQGDAIEAIKHFEEAVVDCATLPELHFATATAYVQLGDVVSARKACEIELLIQPEHDGAKRLLERIKKAINEYEENDNKATKLQVRPIDHSSASDSIQLDDTKRKRTGIIVFGHSRPLLLQNLLRALHQQGTTNDIHVWLDGHHGRSSLIKPVTKCRELVQKEFTEVHLTAMNSNIGIEKLTIDGLSFMSSRYDRIIVLEDDCFPTSCAIDEFEKGLNEIERRPEVYSVYGHHFLTESEGETITRFQGWGWATTREKLLPVLAEMKKCFAMSEPDYLQWAQKNLTPEVIKRLDVTPGRNCVPVIASQFCWDGCTCLVTAMRGLVHKKISKRVIYNCGMGDGSTHFPQNDRFRLPPFNMITPQDVWSYYDSPSDQGSHSVISRKMQSPQTTSPRDTARTSASVATFPGHKSQTRQAEESDNQERLGTQIVVDGLIFTNVKRTKYLNNSVGFNDKYIIKIEHEKHPLKLRSLSDEIEIIKHLNSRECVSCPRLVSEGRLKTGERYFIQERIESQQGFNTADMVFSILEQKNFGVCEGDLKKENLIFDSDSVCYIIDYDQAIYDERFVRMGNIEYLDWFSQFFADRWRRFGHTDFYKWGEYDKNEIFGLFKNDSFNLAATTLFKEQITTNTKSGIYHSLRTDKVYIDGARDLNPRLSALNTIEFKKGESVLDVGCNMGMLGHYLHDRGCRVTGIDMDRKIIIGAKMVANILNKDIQFKHLDLDSEKIETNYDTICLFSVIHHVKRFKQVTENIVQKCSRIILECGLKEHGSKPIGGKWTATSGWEFNSLQKLVCYLETVFKGFKFQKYHGNVDRDRQIISFVKKPAAIAIQAQSKLPANIQEKGVVAQRLSDESEYLISAIVSTYNSERFIRGCLQNLQNQTIADRLEIIVVNSGSQQNEEAIIREFQQKYDNIKYIKTEQRETIYKAWNRAIKASSGKYTTNANTDDRHRQDALEIMARALDENPDKALVYADQLEINEIDGRRVTVGERVNGEFSRSRLFNGECPPGSQPMWRKDVHDVYGYFDEGFMISGDYEFWFRLTQKFGFLYLNDALGERFLGTEAVSQANDDLLSWENEMVIRKCYEYALQEGMTIGATGISEHPVFSRWPEANIWKQNTKAKLEDRGMSLVDNIKDTWDFRTNPSPKLTIVIVTYNRHKELLENLYALNDQKEKDFEVIVMDNGGDLSWLKQHIDEFNFGLCGMELEINFGPSPAKNIGTEFAKAEYIAFLDDDAVADKDLVRNILEHFENYSICGLRGKVLPKTQTDLQSIPVNYDLGDQIINTACEVSSLSTFRKDVLVEMGGFDELLFGSEGIELSYRICKAQKEKVKSILYFPDVIVYHDHCREGPVQTEKILRQHWTALLAWRKDNEIRGYKELVHSLYPGNKAVFENNYNDYTWILNVAIYLQRSFPEESVEWAEKAVALRPDGFKGCYFLGSLYTWFGRYDEALTLLERIYEPLRNSAMSGGSEFVSSEFKEQVDIRECYASICTKLAQCYMQTNQYHKLKQVYTDLLNNQDLTIPPGQKAKIRVLLTKLQNIPLPAPKLKSQLFAPLGASENETNDWISKEDSGQKNDMYSGQQRVLTKSQDTPTRLCTTDSCVPTNNATIGYEQIKDKIAEIEGLLSYNDEKFLFEVAKGLPDNSILVEIGSYKGKSTCCLAYGCVGTNKKVYTIDIGFANKERFNQWKRNVEANNLQNYVIALAGDSRTIVQKWDKKIDFIFIDGSHYYKTVLSDFTGFYHWMKENGIMAFHDVAPNCTGPMRVWQERAKFKLYDNGICGGIAFGRKKADLDKSDGNNDLNTKGTTVEPITKYHTGNLVLPKRRELEIVCSKSSDFEYKYRSNIILGDKKQNILIVHPNSINNFVVFTTVLHCLKEKYTGSHIAIFIQEHIAELAESCPYIDEVIPFDKKAACSNRDYREQIVEQLRNREFDIALYPDSSRTVFGDLITLGSGAREKVTFIGDDNIPHDRKLENNRLYTRVVHLYESGMLETYRYRLFIKQLGLNPGPPIMPKIWLTWEDVNYADNLLKDLQIENPIVICPFAKYAVLQWPIHKWADLISHYQDYPIIICGTQESKKQADELTALAKNNDIHNLCGQTTLRQLAALLHRARLCVALESGPVHIACAVDCPNIVITGGGQFGRYIPYSHITTVVYVPFDCYNCNWQCKYSEPLCIKQIKVRTVNKAVNELLNGSSKDHLPLWPQIEENEGDFIQTKTQVGTNVTDSKYLVSAIVSTYNSEKFLRGCLDDLEQQTIANKLEIIVINSGSQENEEAIVHEYQQKHNNIIYIKTEQREGIYTAWNRAIKVARGTFLTNANTDDRHREDALEIMSETLLTNPDVALVYGDQICTDTPNCTFANHHAIEMAKRPEYSQERLLFGCCVGSQPMWRKSLHNEFGYFDDTLTCAGDWDFWLRISSKYKFKHMPKFLGLYYYNEDGIEHGKKIHSLYERYVVGKRYGNPYISVIPLYTSKNNPLVSVIMPAYNAAEHVAEAIESVLIQNYRNFELIVVDDGSTDDTKDIVTSFKDDKIKYFYKDNSGPSSARNLAISEAKGQYIIPLDADDMMTPDSIAKHLAEFDKHPDVDLVYCDVLLIGENSNPIRIMNKPEYQDRRYLIRDLLRAGHPIVPFRLGIRRSVFDRIGFYDEDLLIAEDYDMMRRFVKAGLQAHHLSETLHLRRMHADSLSGNCSAQKAKCHFDVIKRYIDTFAYNELFPDVAWDEIAPQMRQLHAKCLAAGTYLAIAQNYVRTKATECSRIALDLACSELNDCVKMDPENQGLRQLSQKSKLIRAKYTEAPQQVVS